MKKLPLAIALVTLSGCADPDVWFYQHRMALDSDRPAASGASSASDQRPEWLRDPARGDYPYSPKGW